MRDLRHVIEYNNPIKEGGGCNFDEGFVPPVTYLQLAGFEIRFCMKHLEKLAALTRAEHALRCRELKGKQQVQAEEAQE